MDNNEKLIASFSVSLNIPNEMVTDKLVYQGIPEWDSITHMVLISQLEEDFSVSIEMDDVIDMSSFVKAKEILAKYSVDF